MMTLYYAPSRQTHRQTAFFLSFGQTFKKTCVVWESYRLTDDGVMPQVETAKVARWLETAEGFSTAVRAKCLDEVRRCPESVRIALMPSQISFDVTIVDEEGQPHFFEFHEEQHARMSVSRPAVVYDALGAPITVPRYIQRLYRDIWRLEHVRPFQVLWADWFDENWRTYRPALMPGVHEYALPGKPRFTTFLDRA